MTGSEELKLPFGLSFQGAALSVFGPVVVVWLIVIGIYVYKFQHGLSADQGQWGEFGDYVGGVLNPVLGTLTLVIVAFTIRVQGRLYQQQQDALKEVRRGTQVQEISTRHQAIEAAVFQLMGSIERRAMSTYIELDPNRVAMVRAAATHYRQLVQGAGDPMRYFGGDAFHAFLALVDAEIEKPIALGHFPTAGQVNSARASGLTKLVTEFEYALGPVMRQISNVLEVCEGYDSNYENDAAIVEGVTGPNSFARIVVASLTLEQLECFALYVFSGPAAGETRRLAEKFSAFVEIPTNWFGWNYR